jgi:hypothetical protein
MRVEAALPALTHHEILRLVEPFVRAGHRPDLAASDRTRRRIVFHPQAVAAEQGQDTPTSAPPLTQTLELDPRNRLDVMRLQTVEDHYLIDTIQEFRRKSLF